MLMSVASGMPGEWSLWTWLFLAVLVVLVPVGYLSALRRFPPQDKEDRAVSSARMAAFFCGLALAALAVVTPMDALGMDYVFTVHMTQHLLFSLAAPPLMLIGLPAGFFRALFNHPWGKRGLRWLTHPVVASVLFNGNIWLWHAPALIFLMMAQPGIHQLASLLYLLTGFLFWWPLVSPLQGEHGALSLGGKLIYLFFSDMPMMLLGAGMTFTQPLYTMPMGPQAQASMPISAGDQQLGGLLMWVGGGLFLYVVVTSIIFLRWMLQQERLQEAAEAAASD